MMAVLLTATAATVVADPGSVTITEDQMRVFQQKITELEATQEQMQSLKDEVARIRSDRGEDWMDERRAEEVKGLIREVIADAETRASYADTSMFAGWNKKFFLASEDGKFLLNLGGQLQFRYVFNRRDKEATASDGKDDNEAGFQFRRTKLSFDGYISSPKFIYEAVIVADRNTGALGLEVGRFEYEFADGASVVFGRHKAPFLREELTSSKRQLAVERTVVNEVFSIGYTEGVGLTMKGDSLRIAVMVNDGQNAGELGGTFASGKDFANDHVDAAFTGRADLRLAGDWKQMDDFAAWSNENTGMFLGAAFHYQVQETGSRNDFNGDSDTADTGEGIDGFFSWTVDGSIETGGFNAYAAIIGQHTQATDAAGIDFNNYGAVIQGGYMVLPDQLEPFARYEWLSLDDDAAGNQTDVSIVTVGANYYMTKHNAKFTLDLLYALDPITSASTTSLYSSGFSGLGLLNDAATEDGQLAVRAQFQLLF
jgi:hypothetical protein